MNPMRNHSLAAASLIVTLGMFFIGGCSHSAIVRSADLSRGTETAVKPVRLETETPVGYPKHPIGRALL